MEKLKSKYFIGLIGVILINLFILSTFSIHPSENRTDERRYYNQAETIKENGVFAGFQKLKTDYITQNKQSKVDENVGKPHHPLRVGRILFHTFVTLFVPNVNSGGYISFLFMIFLLLGIYFFIEKYWGERQAFFTVTLTAFAPMILGFGARGLSESQFYFFILMIFFSTLNFIHENSKRNLIILTVFIALGLTFKETTILFLPFFLGILVLSKFFLNKEITYKQLAIAIVGPGLILAPIYIIVFSGITDIFEIVFAQSDRHLTGERSELHLGDRNGPWYQYFVDFIVLSPVMMLVFFLSAGYHLNLRKEFWKIPKLFNQIIFLLFIPYSFFAFSLLIKHVRYAIFLDFFFRFFVVLLLLYVADKVITSKLWRRIFLGFSLIVLLLIDLNQYNKFFVDRKLTTIRSYQLLTTENFFETRAVCQNEKKKRFEGRRLVDQSNSYINRGKYEVALEMARYALNFEVVSAEAYFSMGKASYLLQQYNNSLDYFKQALGIDPFLPDVEMFLNEIEEKSVGDELSAKQESSRNVFIKRLDKLVESTY